jgi:hypothetical protein
VRSNPVASEVFADREIKNSVYAANLDRFVRAVVPRKAA